ncbi:MAG: hypothetical protein Tsb002_36050 [Wenzhouxiangellaceae bacterium]
MSACTQVGDAPADHASLLRWAIANWQSEYEIVRYEVQGIENIDLLPRSGYRFLKQDDGRFFYFKPPSIETKATSPAMVEFIASSTALQRLDKEQWQSLVNSLSFDQRLGLFLAVHWQKSLTESRPRILDAEGWPVEVTAQLHQAYRHAPRSVIDYMALHNGFQVNTWFTDADLPLLVDYIKQQIDKGEISFDHDAIEHVYSSEKLRLLVEILFDELFLRGSHRITQLKDEYPAIFSLLIQDTSSNDDVTRLEFFDLFVNIIRKRYLALDRRVERYAINPLALSAVARYRLSRLYGIHQESAQLPVVVFNAVNGSRNRLWVCGAPTSSISLNTGESLDFPATDEGISWRIIEDSAEQGMTTWRCGVGNYHIDKRASNALPDVPFPPALSAKYRNERLNVLITFAMTDGLTTSLVADYLGMLESLAGCRVVANNPVSENIEQRIKADILVADMYLPVVHQLDLGRLKIASHQSVQRVVLSGCGPMNLEVTLYLPTVALGHPAGAAITLSREDLVTIFNQRHSLSMGQLLVMNMSCHSELAVAGWMGAFIESLVETAARPEMVDNQEIPIVIASKRGFSTDYNSIAEHTKYVMVVIDVLRSGGDLAALYHSLDKPGWMARSFEPVTNWSSEYRTGYQVLQNDQLIIEGNDGEQYIF